MAPAFQLKLSEFLSKFVKLNQALQYEKLKYDMRDAYALSAWITL
jgi:hypothetical protein